MMLQGAPSYKSFVKIWVIYSKRGSDYIIRTKGIFEKKIERARIRKVEKVIVKIETH